MSPSRPASLSLRCKLENEPWSWTPIIATLGNTWRASGLRLSNAHIVEQISEAGPGGRDQYLRHFYLRRDSLWHSRKSGFKVLTPIKAFGQSIRDKLRENGGAEPPEHKCSFLHGLLGLAARLGVSLAVFFSNYNSAASLPYRRQMSLIVDSKSSRQIPNYAIRSATKRRRASVIRAFL